MFVRVTVPVGEKKIFVSQRKKRGWRLFCFVYLPDGEDDEVCFERGSVLEYDALRGKVGYLAVVLELDLSFADQLARTGIYRIWRREG